MRINVHVHVIDVTCHIDVGLKNLYKLVSYSHIELLLSCTTCSTISIKKISRRILVGTACDKGEVFETMMQKSPEEAEEIAQFYDYIEVHA